MRFRATSQLFLIVLTSSYPALRCDAQSDSTARKHIPLYGWLTAGIGSSEYPWETTMRTEWLAYGHIAVALRRIDADPGLNVTERIEHSWLLGARTTIGPLLLVAGAGRSHVTGWNSNGEQSGTTSPIPPDNGWTAHDEASVTLADYVGFGIAMYRTRAKEYRNRGWAVFVEAGRLR